MPGHHHGRDVSTPVRCAVVTVSDTRTAADDRSGGVIRAALEEAGHVVQSSTIVPDDAGAIRSAVLAASAARDVTVAVVTGGTGIAPRDVTIEALTDLWRKELPGFGEIFRTLSFAEIGPAAFLSRATAGVIDGTFVAVLPGSPTACSLAMTKLIVPQLPHIAGLLAPGDRQ
jgi:molybdenum cofactor biosynthesis protein B